MTPAPSHPVIAITGVSKKYGALRPLRIQELTVEAGASVAIVGLDQPAAEVFINLMTGASLPDTGTVHVNGRVTSEIADSTEWLGTLDFFGIVSDRSALLEEWTVIQNLAMPFSLEVEPPTDDVRERATRLGAEVGLPQTVWDRRVRELNALNRLRVRLARALALDPSVVVLEHPSATLAREDVASSGHSIRAVAKARGTSIVTLTMDEEFAKAASDRWMKLEAATGKLTQVRLGKMRFWS